MATELALLTSVWFLCSPGLPTFLEVPSGGMEAAASRVIGGLKERIPRHQAPGTRHRFQLEGQMESGHHSSCRTASAKNKAREGWGKRFFLKLGVLLLIT